MSPLLRFQSKPASVCQASKPCVCSSSNAHDTNVPTAVDARTLLDGFLLCAVYDCIVFDVMASPPYAVYYPVYPTACILFYCHCLAPFIVFDLVSSCLALSSYCLIRHRLILPFIIFIFFSYARLERSPIQTNISHSLLVTKWVVGFSTVIQINTSLFFHATESHETRVNQPATLLKPRISFPWLFDTRH